MLAKVRCFGLQGIEAYPADIEVDVAHGLPKLTIVGLADTAIRESGERIKSALKNSGFEWPKGRITVSLAPSDVKKEGASFDLAIALGVLAASGQLDGQKLQRYCFLGELSLDGTLRTCRGILPLGIGATGAGFRDIVCPFENAREAAAIPGINAWPLKTLSETIQFVNDPGERAPFRIETGELSGAACSYPCDFSEVKGQLQAKRAIEVAVAGGHNILSMGTQYDRRASKRTDYVPNVIGHWTQNCVHTVLVN